MSSRPRSRWDSCEQDRIDLFTSTCRQYGCALLLRPFETRLAKVGIDLVCWSVRLDLSASSHPAIKPERHHLHSCPLPRNRSHADVMRLIFGCSQIEHWRLTCFGPFLLFF